MDFRRFAQATSRRTGNPSAFGMAVGLVLVWALSGPVFGFSSTWQLVINTGTTIITFLMVFLIQSSQNRDTEAIQIKLDELIRSLRDADNALMDLEQMEECDLEQLRLRYEQLAQAARGTIDRRREREPPDSPGKNDDTGDQH